MRLLPRGATLEKTLPWILIIGGAIGLLCAGVIMVDKIKLLEDPSFTPNCDLNPIVSCGSVMQSDQSNAFGFPNPIIGLAAFPVVITTGMVLLAGAKLKRWYMLGLQAGTVFGVGFVHWLFYQSVYSINALCPYCMGVWIVTITIFWYVTLYNLRMRNIILSANYRQASEFLQRHHFDILVLWFLVIAVLILKHFWYYYGEQLL